MNEKYLVANIARSHNLGRQSKLSLTTLIWNRRKGYVLNTLKFRTRCDVNRNHNQLPFLTKMKTVYWKPVILGKHLYSPWMLKHQPHDLVMSYSKWNLLTGKCENSLQHSYLKNRASNSGVKFFLHLATKNVIVLDSQIGTVGLYSLNNKNTVWEVTKTGI